jgi:rhodanese-related sulfurtransferase
VHPHYALLTAHAAYISYANPAKPATAACSTSGLLDQKAAATPVLHDLVERSGGVDAATLRRFEAQSHERTLYRFDVRSPAEYAAGRLPGWRHAPGGQLVQATDQYVGTRGARIVLFDPAGGCDVLTAWWLLQLGGYEVYVLEQAAPQILESGPQPLSLPPLPERAAAWPTPYAFEGVQRKRRFKAYLDWERGLVAHPAADGDARIRVLAL